jgi:cytochrome b subunit of formate dehydrogenase/nitrate/TMAO reductase-like tetraheme cytochrome c subunit
VNTQTSSIGRPELSSPRTPFGSTLVAAAFFIAFVGALVLGPASVAGAQQSTSAPAPIAVDSAKCIDCHDDPELKTDDGKSLQVHGAAFKAGAHRRLECADCHVDATTVKHPRNNLGPVPMAVCVDCHEDEMKALEGSIHAEQKGVAAATCSGCHGNVHEVLRARDPNNSMSAVNQIETCGTCHKSMMDGYRDSVHAKALLKSGLVGKSPACTNCHGRAHEIKAHANPESRTAEAHVPETCGDCHSGVLNEWQESVHGALWQQGKPGGPVCTSCHDSHKVKAASTAEMRQHFPNDCGNCHNDVYKTFRDGFHGKASGVGYTQAAMCSDCHTPHSNFPTSDPRSSVHADNLGKTCGACHEGEINAAFLTFDPHANPSDPNRSAIVHYIYLFMTALLIGVFGFFGIHMLLWLQRSLVGKMRGEFPSHHGGPYVRRFTSFQIGLHITIILSFLLLAASGLPLKFSGAPWAQGLMDLLGGAQTAGWLHRLAAIVTFGYFAFHIGGLLYDKFARGDRGNYLWGWRSMTPQLKDGQDLIANLKWFLYMGPRPKFDRWTYWEKFDYLAVFWGVAMIGVSGLLLWFPGFFTKFLPGWTLNVAYVIHSDEALLATGFIFLFHFFHTHIRPEAFPMDPVVFVGAQPLERLKEERPLEYERLVKSGELEKLIVPAPTREQLLRAHVFGFVTVAIGVALAVAIFVGLLGGFGL